MYEVIVLKEGYSKSLTKGQMRAGGTVTLLKGPQNIVVDTGSPWDKDLLLKGLQANGLTPERINYVICSHGHSDHVGNLNLFTSAVHIVSYDICKDDLYIMHDFNQGIPYEIDEFVEIWPTPGHTGADVTVIVRGTKHGTVAVAGDLFECSEDLDDPELWQQSSEQPEIQEQSRIDVLRVADIIIPGHGPMFQVPKEYHQQMRVVMVRAEHYTEECTTVGGAQISSVQSHCLIVETD